MSLKRKLDEYQDPDYEQFASESERSQLKKHRLTSLTEAGPTKDQRHSKLHEIVQREFGAELESKENEINEIESRLLGARHLLAKIRYVAVYSYYNRKSQTYATNEAPVENVNAQYSDSAAGAEETHAASVESPQLQIHPSLKKLIGKRPLNYDEILKVRPMRQAAKKATHQFNQLKKPSKKDRVLANEPDAEQQTPSSQINLPQQIAPNTSKSKIEQINSARRRNQWRHLIVVGNTSKYVGEEEVELKSNVTHKWLVYVGTRTSSPIEQLVSKVRFFLHESYQPNDIIEVSSPPFQLAKRGWGEFTLRLQLYFHSYLQQKPIQIFHKLVLDKRHTGLQTMGAETLVEIWLSTGADTDACEIDEEQRNDTAKIQIKEEPAEVKAEDAKVEKSNLPSTTVLSEADAAPARKKFLKFVDKSGRVSLLEMIADSNNPKVFKLALPRAQQTEATAKACPVGATSSPVPSATKKTQQSLLKPQVSLLKSNVHAIARNVLVANIDGLKDRKIRVFLPKDEASNEVLTAENKFERNFCQTKFSHETAAVRWTLKRLPLFLERANQRPLLQSFPFILQHVEAFTQLTLPQQRSHEWLRARYIRTLIPKHSQFKSFGWSTKHIVIFSRTYGYSPGRVRVRKCETDVAEFSKYKDIIKSTIDREHMYNDAISFNTPVLRWLSDAEGKMKRTQGDDRKYDDDDDDDGEVVVDDASVEKQKASIPIDQREADGAGGRMLSIDSESADECSWIAEMCREIHIKLQPENICDGISYPAAQKLLQISLRSFVEDLLRQAFALKHRTKCDESNTAISRDDILQTLSRIKHFEFLTNKHLGVEK